MKQISEKLKKVVEKNPGCTITQDGNIMRKRNYPVIEVPPDGKRCWMGGARCLIFVFSKHCGNFIVKGYMREAEEFLKKNFTHYFCYKSMWRSSYKPRGIWDFWKDSVVIFSPRRKVSRYMYGCGYRPTYKYSIRPYNRGYGDNEHEENEKIKITLKRLPKRWIPEFDKF